MCGPATRWPAWAATNLCWCCKGCSRGRPKPGGRSRTGRAKSAAGLAGPTLEDAVLYSTPSIGITLFRNQDPSVHELLKRGFGHVPGQGPGPQHLVLFDPAMQAAASARSAWKATSAWVLSATVSAALPARGERRRPPHGVKPWCAGTTPARHGVAGRIHSAGRTNGPDPAAGPAGAAHGLHPAGAVGAAGHLRLDGGRERQRAGVSPPRFREAGVDALRKAAPTRTSSRSS